MDEWGEGSIAVIIVPGHTFLGIRVGGETRYFDPQVKKEYSEQTMLGMKLIKKGTYEILRVDNRNFTDIAYACMEGR